jgi:hypothetical protein
LEDIVKVIKLVLDSKLLLLLVFFFGLWGSLVKPLNMLSDRILAVIDAYIAVHEQEVGVLQRLCDKIDALIAVVSNGLTR